MTRETIETPDEFAPSTEPYALPELRPSEVAELEQVTAEQVVTVRDAQSLIIANLGNDNLPHHLVTADGVEQCGGCAQPWPCRTWVEQIHPQAVAASDTRPAEAPYTAAEVAMAEELGITAAEVREMVRKR